jgi:DNA polymerase III subunit epsilon
MSRTSPPQPRPRSIRHRWQLHRLVDAEFRFLFESPPPDEWIALDCQTTGHDVMQDEIISIDAVRIVGDRIMTSEQLRLLVRPERGVPAHSVCVHLLREQDLAEGLSLGDAVKRLLRFMGSRPLVGCHLEFKLAMLNHAIRPLLGIDLPQPAIAVGGLYRDHKSTQKPSNLQHDARTTDLQLAVMMNDLELPLSVAHETLSGSVQAALAFVKLRHLRAEA